MKTINVLYLTVGLLSAQIVFWMIVLTLYLSVHPEVIQYNVGIT